MKKDKLPLPEHILNEVIISWKVVLMRDIEMLILWFLNPLPSAVPPLAILSSWTSSCRKQKLVTMAPQLLSGKGMPARA